MRAPINKLLCKFLLVVIIVCGACSRHDKALDEAEKLMFEKPDAALSKLNGIDSLNLSEEQKARRALLQAYIATIYVMPSDISSSEMQRALTYFTGDCSENEIKALIIKSELAKGQGEPVQRIELLKDAEFLATQLNDNTDLAFIYLYLSNVYSNGFNGTVSGYYAHKALKLFESLNMKKQSIDARMAIAGAFVVNRDYKAALDSMLALKPDVMRFATDSYKRYFLIELAKTLDENDRTPEAINIYHSQHDTANYTSNIYAHWAYAYMHINKLDSATLMIEKAIALPHNHTDEYLCRNVQYMILQKSGAQDRLPLIDSLRNNASKLVFEERQLEECSLAFNQKYESATLSAWQDLQKASRKTNITIAIAIILVMLVIFAVLYYRKRNRLFRSEHENDMLKIRSLRDNLFEKEHSYNLVATRVSTLIKTRFSVIDRLASSYFESKETGHEQKRIFAEAKALISNFNDKASLQELEDILNTCHDNLITHFDEDFPKLSAAQRTLALFIFCGLSLQSISIFLDTELRNVYVYKSRLKSTIAKSQSPYKDTYLNFF